MHNLFVPYQLSVDIRNCVFKCIGGIVDIGFLISYTLIMSV